MTGKRPKTIGWATALVVVVLVSLVLMGGCGASRPANPASPSLPATVATSSGIPEPVEPIAVSTAPADTAQSMPLEASPKALTDGVPGNGTGLPETADASEDTAQQEKAVAPPPQQAARTPRGRQDVRAVYLTSWTAGNNLDAFLDLLDTTELNAVVIDIREGDGWIFWNAGNTYALGAFMKADEKTP